MWTNGTVTVDGVDYLFEAKVYDRPSSFGINSGRVSKLYIPGIELAWDRGSDNNPKLQHPAVHAVLALFPVQD